jgi:Flp pilus assembly protein TadD
MGKKLHRTLVLAGITLTFTLAAVAGDLKIKIPKPSHLTPVQRLNREGVAELRKHNYERAEALFYKAYLYDPDDPFTLNNLGYISELQGQVDRAEEFYKQAAQVPTDAVIDEATSRSLQGKPMSEALAIPDLPLEINHDNVEAVRLLSQGRASEADLLLQHTLAEEPRNVFTLNNLGVTKEMEGETQEALRYYDEAASSGSNASAIVTENRAWRGKPASEMAARNAQALRARMATENTLAAQVNSLNARGVSAVNRNDLETAENDFRAAYKLDPDNAFTLNNIGYVAELNGDRETAQFFYDHALQAAGSNTVVGLATRRDAEGKVLFQVASNSTGAVENALTAEREVRQRQHAPVVLLRRDNSVVQEPTPHSNAPLRQSPPQSQSSPQ